MARGLPVPVPGRPPRTACGPAAVTAPTGRRAWPALATLLAGSLVVLVAGCSQAGAPWRAAVDGADVDTARATAATAPIPPRDGLAVAARVPAEATTTARAGSSPGGRRATGATDRSADPAVDPPTSTATTPPTTTPATTAAGRASFGRATRVSADVRRLADWIARTHDNDSRDVVLVDKRAARVYVFDRSLRLQADAPALLGAARGDHTVPGIGDRPLAQVLPHERTTPAGRFVAEPGINAGGEDVVWVDYDAAVSMHRVRTSNPAERRQARLDSPGVADNRISWGCINLPVRFYETQLRPRVHGGPGAVVYVLPEVRTLAQVFGLPAASPAPTGRTPRSAARDGRPAATAPARPPAGAAQAQAVASPRRSP